MCRESRMFRELRERAHTSCMVTLSPRLPEISGHRGSQRPIICIELRWRIKVRKKTSFRTHILHKRLWENPKPRDPRASMTVHSLASLVGVAPRYPSLVLRLKSQRSPRSRWMLSLGASRSDIRKRWLRRWPTRNSLKRSWTRSWATLQPPREMKWATAPVLTPSRISAVQRRRVLLKLKSEKSIFILKMPKKSQESSTNQPQWRNITTAWLWVPLISHFRHRCMLRVDVKHLQRSHRRITSKCSTEVSAQTRPAHPHFLSLRSSLTSTMEASLHAHLIKQPRPAWAWATANLVSEVPRSSTRVSLWTTFNGSARPHLMLAVQSSTRQDNILRLTSSHHQEERAPQEKSRKLHQVELDHQRATTKRSWLMMRRSIEPGRERCTSTRPWML